MTDMLESSIGPEDSESFIAAGGRRWPVSGWV